LEIKENRTRTAPRRLLSSILLRLAFGGGGSLTFTKLCRTNRAVGRTEVVYRSQVCGLANCAVIPLVRTAGPEPAQGFPQTLVGRPRFLRNWSVKPAHKHGSLPEFIVIPSLSFIIAISIAPYFCAALSCGSVLSAHIKKSVRPTLTTQKSHFIRAI
jgi:hypothetical protein